MDDIARVGILGFLMLEAVLLFTRYEGAVEAMAAIVFVMAVIAGFAMHPRKNVFYVRTIMPTRTRSGHAAKEQDVLAVRVELVRLWVLFIPTMLAVGLLVFSAARGKLWEYSVLNRVLPVPFSLFAAQIMMYSPFAIVLLLSVWIGERWIMRNPEACYARDFRINGRTISFQFLGEQGEYYGGYGIYFGLVRSVELASIVFDDPRKWQRNRIAMGMLFHRIVVLGRDVTDLDADTVKQHSVLAEPATSEAG
jgi:hypothetical protein